MSDTENLISLEDLEYGKYYMIGTYRVVRLVEGMKPKKVEDGELETWGACFHILELKIGRVWYEGVLFKNPKFRCFRPATMKSMSSTIKLFQAKLKIARDSNDLLAELINKID